MAEGLFTLGWRKIGIRVIATEAFCDPPHKGVIAELRAITPEVVMLGDALRWTVDKKGKLKALDPLVGVPTSVIRRVGDLANMAVHSVTAHVEDVMTLEMKEITTDILIMMSERRGELLQLVLGMAQEPTHPVEDPIMAIGFDHGSPIVIVGADRAPRWSRRWSNGRATSVCGRSRTRSATFRPPRSPGTGRSRSRCRACR